MKTSFKRIASIIMAAMLLISALGATSFAASANDAKQGVVLIKGDYGISTGFAIGKVGQPVEYIVASYDIVWDSTEVVVVFNGSANEYVTATVCASDKRNNVAILRLPQPTNKLVPLVLCPPQDTDVSGKFSNLSYPTYNPENWNKYSIDDVVITQGNISKIATKAGFIVYELSSSFANGSFGGPLVNSDGEVVAFTTFYDAGSYAVMVDALISLVNQNNIPVTLHSEAKQQPAGNNATGSFTDVRTSDSYAKAVEFMAIKGVITGYSDGTFKPNNTLTRAEAATIICRLNGDFNLEKTNTKFTDVPKENWASGYIARATELGIINGVGNNKYNPNGILTVEQFTKMLVCWIGFEKEALELGGWPNGYIEVAKTNGFLMNISTTNYKSNITRADACVIAESVSVLNSILKSV